MSCWLVALGNLSYHGVVLICVHQRHEFPNAGPVPSHGVEITTLTCVQLMGLAVYNSINLDVRFPTVCYRKLLSPAVVPFNNPRATVGITPATLDDLRKVVPVSILLLKRSGWMGFWNVCVRACVLWWWCVHDVCVWLCVCVYVSVWLCVCVCEYVCVCVWERDTERERDIYW